MAQSSPITEAHLRCAAAPYSAANPNGIINLGTAENFLMEDWLREKLPQCLAVADSDVHYGGHAGLELFRQQLGRFLSRKFDAAIPGDSLVMTPGAIGALEMAAYLFAESGDGFLVPAPYYPAFRFDLGARAGVRVIEAPLSSRDDYRLTRSVLEVGMATAEREGVRVRAMLVTSPGNPLGNVLSHEEVRTALAFARERKLEAIFDEVYGCSVHSGEQKFVSAAKVREEFPDFRDHVHLIYSFSKDFTAGGFRIGALHTPRAEGVQMAARFANFAMLPSPHQRMAANLLADEAWVDRFLDESRVRLAKQLAFFRQAMQRTPAKFLPPRAGVFAWLDFRAALREPTFAAENELFEKFIGEAKVSILPGGAFGSPEPGWFRACFAHPTKTLTAATDRLTALFERRV